MKSFGKIFCSMFCLILFLLSSCSSSINSLNEYIFITNSVILTIIIFCFIALIFLLIILFALTDYDDLLFRNRTYFYIGYPVLWLIVSCILLFVFNDGTTDKSIAKMLDLIWQRAPINVIMKRMVLIFGLLILHTPYAYLLPRKTTEYYGEHGILGFGAYKRQTSSSEGSWIFTIGIGLLILLLLVLLVTNTYFLTSYIKLSIVVYSIITSIIFFSTISLVLFVLRNLEKIENFIIWLFQDFSYEYKRCNNIFEVFSYYVNFEIKRNLSNYKNFLVKYPNSPYSYKAKEKIKEHTKIAEDQRDYIFNKLSSDINCKIKIEETPDGINLIAISHLHPGLSPDDNSPYLSIFNKSLDLIQIEVYERLSKILTKIIGYSCYVGINKITIEIKHGVREGNQNKSSTIYSASISGKKANRWFNKKRKISSYINVTKNIIPQLKIQYESRK